MAGMPMDDTLRMLAAKAGDMAAFEGLVLDYQRPLVAFFDRLLHNGPLAEEFAQEVFCRLYQCREDYEPKASFQSYLYRIAKNLWIDHVRHRAAGPRILSMDAPMTPEAEAPLQAALAGREPGPAAGLEAEERAVAVRSAVDALPERLRLVFVMGEGQGLSYVEIGETLGIPVGTVKSRMHAAVLQLRTALAGVVEA